MFCVKQSETYFNFCECIYRELDSGQGSAAEHVMKSSFPTLPINFVKMYQTLRKANRSQNYIKDIKRAAKIQNAASEYIHTNENPH